MAKNVRPPAYREQEVEAHVRAKFREDLPKVFKRVLAEAVLLVRRTRWGGASPATVQDRAEELAQEAVCRVLLGTRDWDPTRVPDLHYFLLGVMRSIVSHAAEREGDRPAQVETGDTDADVAARGLARGGMSPSPEERPLSDEEVDDRVNQLLDAAGNDPVLEKVVSAVVGGCAKADEVVAETGLEPEQVYGALRKLRRRIASARRRAHS
jgi:hypothetical protein